MRIAAIIIFLLVAVTGYGRTYNYQDVPVGERSFGMGGACQAVSGDVGTMYWNPATLGDEEAGQVSAALSTYTRIDTRNGEFVSLFKSAIDNVTRGGFLAIPSMVGGGVEWGSWHVGGSILVPGMFENSGTVALTERSVASFESRYEAVWLGIFAARKWGRHNFGLSLFYGSYEWNEKFFFVKGDQDPVTIRIVENGLTANGAVAILGDTYQLNSDIRLGFSLRLPALPLGVDGNFADAESGQSLTATADTFKSKYFAIPWRLGAGVAYQVRGDLLLAADLYFYGAYRGYPAGLENTAFEVDAKPVLNVSLGAEYFYWPEVGFRAGAFSNMSAARETSQTLTGLNDKVHMFGGTAAIVFDKDTGSISLGGYLQGGQGRATAIDEQLRRVPRSNYFYGFVLASNYRF